MMHEILRAVFDRQMKLFIVFVVVIRVAEAKLLRAGVELPDVPLLVQVVMEAAAIYALTALVWWVWDRWQGKQKH